MKMNVLDIITLVMNGSPEVYTPVGTCAYVDVSEVMVIPDLPSPGKKKGSTSARSKLHNTLVPQPRHQQTRITLETYTAPTAAPP